MAASAPSLPTYPAATRTRGASTPALFQRLRHTRDPEVRDILVRRFLPLARKLARRYYGGGESLEDLVQVANLGLVKAVQRFDQDRGVAFTSYAVPTITGELKRYFRDNAWAAHVPRGLRERAVKVHKAMRDLAERSGRPPTTRDVAQRLELDEQDVLEAREAYDAFEAASLDEPVAHQDDGTPQPRSETIGAEDDRYARAEDRAMLGGALARLPRQDRRVLHMRFVEDRTQADIASRIGVSQMQVSRILRRTLDRVRDSVQSTSTRPRRWR
jgi:RNA polymerase sigma-B factor